MKFFRRLLDELAAGNPLVLAIVIQTKGSTPRERGAKMLIRARGQIHGTIGGGAGEAKIIAAAQNVFATGAKKTVEIDLTAPAADGICGGKMLIHLERWHGAAAINLARKIVETLDAGANVRLAIDLQSEKPPVLLSPEAAAPDGFFVETIAPAPILLIVGAGHVGIELARIAAQIEFQIIVNDDRAEWTTPEKHLPDTLVLRESIDETIRRLENRPDVFVTLVTRGFEYDLRALTALFARAAPCRYVGMIGSEKRVRQVFRELKKAGICEEKLQTVHAPIGLDIGALTPAEIAVSIAAELILIRRGGTGKSFAQRL